MGKESHLSAGDKIILCLEAKKSGKAFPVQSSQKGLANMTGLLLNHVPRTLKRLLGEGLVDVKRSRIQGHNRRLKCYYLTAQGLSRKDELLDEIQEMQVSVDIDGGRTAVNELREYLFEDVLYALMNDTLLGEKRSEQFAPNRDYEKSQTTPKKYSGVQDVLPEKKLIWGDIPDIPDPFLGRDEVLKNIVDWSTKESPVMVLYGPAGVGKTALAANLANEPQWGSVLWFQLKKDAGQDDILREMRGFVEREDLDVGEGSLVSTIEGIASNSPVLMVFDGYGEMWDEVVELFEELKEIVGKNSSDEKGIKVLFTALDTTPFYSRFYSQGDADVTEEHVPGLDDESSRAIINPDVGDEALKKIMLMTKGKPGTLLLLKKGDTEELAKRSRFTPEEIRLLMFLKDDTK